MSCVAVSGNETKEIELGRLNVMHEPENIKISRNPEQITCSADVSKYDEVTASLVMNEPFLFYLAYFKSLNRNVIEKVEDGKSNYTI